MTCNKHALNAVFFCNNLFSQLPLLLFLLSQQFSALPLTLHVLLSQVFSFFFLLRSR